MQSAPKATTYMGQTYWHKTNGHSKSSQVIYFGMNAKAKMDFDT